MKLLYKASRSVYISGFSFSVDDSTIEMFDVLCRKARNEEVQVRVLADASASKQLYKLEKQLLDCGIHLMFYNPRHGKVLHKEVLPSRWGFNHSMNIIHEKFLMVDGEAMVMGGSNFGNWYTKAKRENDTKGTAHDLNVRIDGPAVCVYQDYYEKNWKQSVEKDLNRALRFKAKRRKKMARIYGNEDFIECDPVKKGNSRVIPVYANPMFSKKRPLMEIYKKAIASSTKEIQLLAPYFQPTDEYIKLLLDARKRGVVVKVLTNSPESNDEELSTFATYSLIAPLIKAGVEFHLWPRLSTFHRKAGIFDGKVAYVGSDNLSGRAQNYNSEAIAVTDDAEIVKVLLEEFALDFDGAEILDEEQRASTYEKVNPWLKRAFKYIRPYM